MSRVTIKSELPGGGDVLWLDRLGLITGLEYQTTYPGGDSEASWQITLDTRAKHRAWLYGRLISLCLGASELWHGYLDNPTRGTAWQMRAIGRAALAKDYVAYAPTSGNALTLNEVIDQANSRGLPFTRAGSLPSLSSGFEQSGTIMVDAALDEVAAGQSAESYWSIDTNGVMPTSWAAPTTPTYVLYATVPGGGRSLDGLATDAFVLYQSATGVLSVAIRTAASRPYGRFEAPVDKTTLGLIPSSQANALGDGFLARNSARLRFISDFTVTPGQLVTLGGAAVDLATVRAGFLANVIITDPDSAGEVALASIPQVLIGATRYDVDADTLTLTPVYAAQDNLEALLGAGSLRQ